jgi:excinuclease ABC subunit A
VLDEPSIGLHQRDNDRLLDNAEAPARSRQHGASSSSMTRTRSDGRLPDRYGPGRRHPWRRDHRASGTPEDLMANERSITGNYLSGEEDRSITVPATRRWPQEENQQSCSHRRREGATT